MQARTLSDPFFGGSMILVVHDVCPLGDPFSLMWLNDNEISFNQLSCLQTSESEVQAFFERSMPFSKQLVCTRAPFSFFLTFKFAGLRERCVGGI